MSQDSQQFDLDELELGLKALEAEIAAEAEFEPEPAPEPELKVSEPKRHHHEMRPMSRKTAVPKRGHKNATNFRI